jgi:hypothetical protein
MKAVELIEEAQISARETVGDDYHTKMSQAIALLALARFFRGANGAVQSKRNKATGAGGCDKEGPSRDADA